MGESFGIYRLGNDELLLGIIKSANIATGFHAGDPWVLTQTVKMAHDHHVSIGAHPSFPDLQGFGRRIMHIDAHELRAIVLYQLGALDGIGRGAGIKATHVKPHGALNNMACADDDIANVIATAVRDYDRDLILLAPVFSKLAEAGQQAGLKVALEVFSDRTYTDEGLLVPRSDPRAVIHDSEDCVAHVLRMLESGGVVSINGRRLKTPFHSVCLHGDNVHAVETATLVKGALRDNGFNLVTLPELF